jgi:release factor glutamine methyltransferase
MTLREALISAIAQLRAVPELRDEASEDATLLLLHALNISRATLLTTYDRILTAGEEAACQAAIARRLTHEPVQYITGEREFFGRPLRVTPAVLIPRNLTEHLVESVLDEFRARNRSGKSLRIADVGTGSGAIAIALAFHLPGAHLTALDISPTALAVAAGNAERNGVSTRIRFLQSDLIKAVIDDAPFDAIVSNPPYIATTERGALQPQVREYEPSTALYAGETGLDIYRRLIPQAHKALKPNGLLALEIGPAQRDPIAALLSGWSEIRFVLDFDQTPRIALARRP